MRLIQFKDGEYGVIKRKAWFMEQKFMDLVNIGYSWTKSSECFCDCRGSKELALAAIDGAEFTVIEDKE